MAEKKRIRKVPGKVMCTTKEIAVWEENTNITICHLCAKCRRAYGLNHPCGTVLKLLKDSNTTIGCERCIKGSNFSPNKSTDMCKRCTICQKNRVVKRNCTRRSDTVCSKKCKKKFYEEQDALGLSSCEPCSQCCGDGKDNLQQECIDQGFPSDKACSYWDAERCKKHRDPSIKTASSPSTLPSSGFTSPLPFPSPISNIFATTSSPQDPQPLVINNVSTGMNTAALLASIFSVVFVVALVGGILLKHFRRRRNVTRSTNNETSADPQTIPLQDLQHAESTKLTPWLDDPETHKSGGRFDQICGKMNSLKKRKFESVCISLGIPSWNVHEFFPHEGTGKFGDVLRTLSTEIRPELTLEDIAQKCKKYQSVVDMLLEEDRRLQNKLSH